MFNVASEAQFPVRQPIIVPKLLNTTLSNSSSQLLTNPSPSKIFRPLNRNIQVNTLVLNDNVGNRRGRPKKQKG